MQKMVDSGGGARPSLNVALALALAAGVAAPAPAQSPRPATELVGLWSASRDFTAGARGALTIAERRGVWQASIAGLVVSVRVEGERVRLELPGDRGAFRGRFDGERIRGHWIQPRTYSNFAPYASPVTLEAAGPRRWRGTVTPLDDRLRFFLVVEPGEGGAVRAFLRNPEANVGRFYPIERIVLDGDRVRFLDADGAERLEGVWRPDAGRLSIHFPYNGGTYDFVRADDDPASGFLPRPPDAPPYRYAPPEPDDDGWETASLEEVGMDAGPIEALVEAIAATPIDAIDAPYVHAFLVARHGKLAFEAYFHGYRRDLPHGTRSASKSVTTTLVGVAARRGDVSLDTPVYATMAGGSAPPGLDPRADRMTIEHLITMTPGWACDDWDQDSPGNEDRMQSQTDEPDWFRYAMDLPMLHEPGAVAAYCSAAPNLAGGVVARATGTWLPEYYRDHFAEPMEMGLYHMNLTPTGEAYGGGGLHILPRDFLKLGQIFLDEGRWKGRPIVTPEWTREAVEPRNRIGDEGYGYGWWTFRYPYRGREIDAFYAGGNGGQYVIVVPELDLAIAIFGGNYNQRVMHRPKYELVREYVVPAVRDGAGSP